MHPNPLLPSPVTTQAYKNRYESKAERQLYSRDPRVTFPDQQVAGSLLRPNRGGEPAEQNNEHGARTEVDRHDCLDEHDFASRQAA